MENPPNIESFADIPSKIGEITRWVDGNPNREHVYCFKWEDHLTKVGSSVTAKGLYNPSYAGNSCVAGSAAVAHVYDLLFRTTRRNWKANDVDVFLLGQTHNARFPSVGIDLVMTEDKTVEELLINFDLPICRAAYTFTYDIYISAQCMVALYTNRQYVPSYLKNDASFKKMMRNYQVGEPVNEAAHTYLYLRFSERIQKYQSRGYPTVWVDTPVIIPWVKNRFHYGEWSMMADSSYKPKHHATCLCEGTDILRHITSSGEVRHIMCPVQHDQSTPTTIWTSTSTSTVPSTSTSTLSSIPTSTSLST